MRNQEFRNYLSDIDITRRVLFMRKFMQMKKWICIFGVCAVVLTATGCANETVEQQDAFFQYGLNCMADGKYDDAAAAFQNALNQSRGTVSAREIDLCYYKAEALYMAGQPDAACETYDAIIEYNGASDAYYLRGCLKMKMGQTDDGLSDFAAAVEKDKNDYELYIGIYEALAENNLMGQGQAYLNQALDIRGDKSYDKMEKGRIYLLLDDTSSAITYLKEAVDKESVEAEYYLGLAYETAGDNANADIYYQMYLESGTADSRELCEMGERQLKNKNYSLALDYFQTALEQESVMNKAQILRDMSIAYENMGNFSMAKSTLQQYLEFYPEDEDAQREMVFLETR